MTAPLTPPDCDLQDFAFMPLQVARLRDSDLAAEANPEACWYAVMLWAASWHQIPAASLPDNETVLTKLCGLGRDLKTFRKHRAEAMRGFVLCDDGRLYHTTVAEQAIVSWESKRQQRWRSECARIKKANQRNGTSIEPPTYEAFLSSTYATPCPQSVPGDTEECPSGQALQETGTGTGTGTSIEEATASLSPVGDGTRTDGQLFEDAWAAYPHVKGRGSRKRALAAWRRLPPQVKAAMPAGAALYAREGLEPRRDCGAPGMHIWLADEKFADWIAGKPFSQLPTWAGPPELRARVVMEAGESFARSYLDPASWADGALTPRNGFAADKLRPLNALKGVQILKPAQEAAA